MACWSSTLLWSRTLWISLEMPFLVTIPTMSWGSVWPVPGGGIGTSVLTKLLVSGLGCLPGWLDERV